MGYALHVAQAGGKHPDAKPLKGFKGRKAMNDSIKAEKSSGNVFADLGVADPEEALAKAELTRQISEIISKRHMSQKEAAAILGIDQPKVSGLIRGRLSGFSTERLLRFLNNLGRDVEIVIKAKPHFRRRATISVITA